MPAPAHIEASRTAPEGVRSYRAFLSYSHTDTEWATWLLRRLEGYRVPERFHGRVAPIGGIGARIAPVFRDRDELPTADDLGDAVRDALARSATLIVICSPAAAQSRWVNEEVLAFKRLGRADRVFALIVAGEPGAKDPAQECFPPALRFDLGSQGALTDRPVELVAADARPHTDGKDTAFIRLVAGLLGVGFDDLRQREHARRLRRMMWITVGSTVGMAITLGLAVLAMRARDDAQRRQEKSERLMARMLDDLKLRLEKADRLDPLNASANEALAYFESLNPRDLTDTTLTQQARLFTQIGQMRLAQLRYPDALTCFHAALDRTRALVERHPREGDALFERAQAEYYVGSVFYSQGKYAETVEWWVRYRDSGVALTGLDPKNPRWLREAVSGLHNLAVLELRRGNLSAARAGLLRERTGHEKLAPMMPGDAELENSIATVDSFLGTLDEREGLLADAIAHFGAQVSRLEKLAKTEPASAKAQQRLATAQGLQSDTMGLCGQVSAALELRQRALKIFEALIAQDPANREWQVLASTSRLRIAAYWWAQGEVASATRLVRESRALLEGLAKSGASSRAFIAAQALAWKLETQLRDAAGEPGASEAAAQAVATSKSLVELDRNDEVNVSSYANALIVAGTQARHEGDEVKAREYWQTALGAIEAPARSSSSCRLLDPVARALALLGRGDESRAFVSRLEKIGYRPLEPWPPMAR